MFPYFRKGSYILILLVAFLFLSSLVVLLYWQFFQATLFQSLLIHIFPLLLLFSFSLSSWFLCVNLEFRKPRILLNTLYLFLSSLVVLGLWFLGSYLYIILVFRIHPGTAVTRLFWENIYFNLSLGAGIYLSFLLVHFLIITIHKRKEAELRATQNILEKTRAELKFLKASIHPHFLFNSLNLLIPLIGRQPDLAREALTHLSEFLLYSLRFGKKEQVPLGDELEHIRDYLAIEKLRLQERLRVSYRIDPGARDCLVPPLTLLPVLENAVKHGIEPLIRGGTLTVEIRRLPARKLEIQVQNPCRAEKETGPGSGLGLYILKRRLQDYFGSAVTIIIRDQGGVFTINITVPAREKP